MVKFRWPKGFKLRVGVCFITVYFICVCMCYKTHTNTYKVHRNKTRDERKFLEQLLFSAVTHAVAGTGHGGLATVAPVAVAYPSHANLVKPNCRG